MGRNFRLCEPFTLQIVSPVMDVFIHIMSLPDCSFKSNHAETSKIFNSDTALECTTQSFLNIWISVQNRNSIRKYFSLFIRGPNEFESWKQYKSKILWHIHFKTTVPRRFKLRRLSPIAVSAVIYSIQTGSALVQYMYPYRARVFSHQQMGFNWLNPSYCRV